MPLAACCAAGESLPQLPQPCRSSLAGPRGIHSRHGCGSVRVSWTWCRKISAFLPFRFRMLLFSPKFPSGPAATGVALLLTSCGRKDRVEVRPFPRPFYQRACAHSGPDHRATLCRQRRPGHAALDHAGQAGTFLPATDFRHINFDFGPNREGEAYLTLLPVNGGGGVLDNFNRWRQTDGPTAPDRSRSRHLATKTHLRPPCAFP